MLRLTSVKQFLLARLHNSWLVYRGSHLQCDQMRLKAASKQSGVFSTHLRKFES